VGPLFPFVGQGPGWGARSSKSAGYLRNVPFSTFKKNGSYGFFSQSYIPAEVLLSRKDVFLRGSSDLIDSLACESNFLVTLDLNLRGFLLAERAFCKEGSASPNLIPQNEAPSLDAEALLEECDVYVSWTTGTSPLQGLFVASSLLFCLKGHLARRLVSLSL
jgi:hypothetical protein